MLDSIPRTAKPHEVAILYFYFAYKSVKKVARYLHYDHTSSVYRVLCKYNIRSKPQ